MIEKSEKTKEIDNILKTHFEGYINSSDPYEKFLIYKYNEKIIGLITYSIIYERAEINYIYVEEEYRKKHIGTLLLKAAIEDIKNVNSEIITLEVNENNIPAIKLYEKEGFQITAIRSNYYGKNNGYLLMKEVK